MASSWEAPKWRPKGGAEMANPSGVKVVSPGGAAKWRPKGGGVVMAFPEEGDAEMAFPGGAPK